MGVSASCPQHSGSVRALSQEIEAASEKRQGIRTMHPETMDAKDKKTGGKTILVIEDNPDTLSMIIDYLESLRYGFISAMDGMEGLKQLETGDFNLVITDIVIPYVSGVGVVSALKEKRPNTPVIVITGYGKESEAVALEKQADVVLPKPINMAVLKDHISRLLS